MCKQLIDFVLRTESVDCHCMTHVCAGEKYNIDLSSRSCLMLSDEFDGENCSFVIIFRAILMLNCVSEVFLNKCNFTGIKTHLNPRIVDGKLKFQKIKYKKL